MRAGKRRRAQGLRYMLDLILSLFYVVQKKFILVVFMHETHWNRASVKISPWLVKNFHFKILGKTRYPKTNLRNGCCISRK